MCVCAATFGITVDPQILSDSRLSEIGNNCSIKSILMLVAHLFGVNVSIATSPMSILCLPRSIDCGGSLVNVWGLDYLCWINIYLYFLWPNMYGLFCFKTMDTWVRRNSESGNCFHSSEFLVLKPQKGGPSKDGGTFHPSSLLW